MMSYDFCGETTASPLRDPDSESGALQLMALIKARDLGDAKRKNAACHKAKNPVAALKRRLIEMETALEEEQSRYLDLAEDYSHMEATLDRQKTAQQTQSQTLDELVQALRHEAKALRHDIDQDIRNMETELRDVTAQLNEKRAQVAELQQQLDKREGELSQVIIKCDEETAAHAQTQQVLREIENQLGALQEDLETENDARLKAEKQKRDLNAEMEALKNALLDAAASQQELRTNHTLELDIFKKTLQDVSVAHELQIANLRQEHNQAMEEIHEQLADLKKTTTNLEHVNADLEASIEAEKEQNQALRAEKQQLQINVQNLEDQLAAKVMLLHKTNDEQQRKQRISKNERLTLPDHATDTPVSVHSVIEERPFIHSDKIDENREKAIDRNLESSAPYSAAASDESKPESGHYSDSDYVILVGKPKFKAKSGTDDDEEDTTRVGELIADIFGDSDADKEFESFAEEDLAAFKKTERQRSKFKVISASEDGGQAKSKNGGTGPATASLKFSVNDEPTPLLQLMNKHGKSPTAKRNIRKAPAVGGRPKMSSSSVVQNCTGASVNSAMLQQELQS